MDKPDCCPKCGRVCMDKDSRLRGPLEGEFAWLCAPCYHNQDMVSKVRWKS